MYSVQALPVPNLLSRYFDNLLHLKAVVDAGSINRAAMAIHMSQPALTRSIGKLEAAVGARLLTRVAKGVYPTEFGQALLEHVRAVDCELERAATTLKIMKGRTGGPLACGGTFLSMSLLVPLAVKEFDKSKRGSHVRLVEGPTDTLLKLLRLGELDIVVGTRISDDGYEDLIAEELATEHVGIFAHNSHKLFTQQHLSLKRLVATEKWILPSPPGPLYQLIEKEFARHALDLPRHFIETSSLIAVRKLIPITGYIAVASSMVVAPSLIDGTSRELSGDWRFPTTTITAFYRAGDANSAAATLFAECLRRIAKSLPVSFAGAA
ncbi:MAG: LysR family transcriptional regulator [Pseudomonadota bacterium]|nr:LysR family transcriptional regulator [Pseudomonadota bacterium]